MELKKLAIALLALYIVHCFISKEKYAFDEPGVEFPMNDPDVGYIDIYHKKDIKGNYQIHSLKYSSNIAPENKGVTTASGNVATIDSFTPKVAKSITLYGVNYDDNKNVAYYRPVDNKNSTIIQVEMKPGKQIIFRNLTAGNLGASFGKSNFTKDDIIHTGRFVFTF
jgi:hypothetical protein